MLSSLKARQSVREKKKVSKKPEMPMIIAAEVSGLVKNTLYRLVT